METEHNFIVKIHSDIKQEYVCRDMTGKETAPSLQSAESIFNNQPCSNLFLKTKLSLVKLTQDE